MTTYAKAKILSHYVSLKYSAAITTFFYIFLSTSQYFNKDSFSVSETISGLNKNLSILLFIILNSVKS